MEFLKKVQTNGEGLNIASKSYKSHRQILQNHSCLLNNPSKNCGNWRPKLHAGCFHDTKANLAGSQKGHLAP